MWELVRSLGVEPEGSVRQGYQGRTVLGVQPALGCPSAESAFPPVCRAVCFSMVSRLKLTLFDPKSWQFENLNVGYSYLKSLIKAGNFRGAILFSVLFGTHPILQGPPRTNHFILWNTSLWAEKGPVQKTLFYLRLNRIVCLSCSRNCQVLRSPSHSPSQIGLIYLCDRRQIYFLSCEVFE